VAKITPVKQNVQKAIDTFKGQTKGIKKLYSCQSQWAYVENVQEALEQQQKEISEIEKNITQQHSRLQEILLSLGS
jgi:peptidoglycan hydrolase CwlO-like protein